jgi:hypothetical protein
MRSELVVDEHAARRGGVELLDDGQVCWVLRVLPKPDRIFEAGEKAWA